MTPAERAAAIARRPSRFFRLHDGLSVHGRLFQAHMWIEHAKAIERGSRWEEIFMQLDRAGCLRLAKANLYAAKRLNRRNP